ncbi:MAG: ArsR family transcriptional regulator [Mesorhizobium sp.]|nr:MAG: ArsR family transcriptional regulator [Mesorhizobium sp.]
MMTLVSRLQTAAHLDRLRILGLCAHADLTICELAEVLGLRREQVVRHVRVLTRANGDGHHKRDLQRLEAIQDARSKGPPA